MDTKCEICEAQLSSIKLMCLTCSAQAEKLLSQMQVHVSQLVRVARKAWGPMPGGRPFKVPSAVKNAVRREESDMFLKWSRYVAGRRETPVTCAVSTPELVAEQHACHCDTLEMLRNGCRCGGV